MPIVGVNFTKIHAERSGSLDGKININNNVSLKDVKRADIDLGKSKQASLRFEFEFTAKYEPKSGEILLTGDVLMIDNEQAVADIEAGWKKSKTIPKELTATLMNSILNKCNVEAIILSRDIGLPSPIPLPKLDNK